MGDLSIGILLERDRQVPTFSEEYALRLRQRFIPGFAIVRHIETAAFRFDKYHRASLAYLVLSGVGRDHVRRDLNRHPPRRSGFPLRRVEWNVAEPIIRRATVAYARRHYLRSHRLEVGAVAEQHNADARLPVDYGVV